MGNAMSIDQQSIRVQALANEDPSASAWLSACPAWYNNRTNDVSFKIAFQLRNLLPVIEQDQHWCHCGMEMDTLTAHSYVCGNQSTRSKIRNPFHRRLCEVLKRISNEILMDAGMIALNGEPACADHLPLKPRANSFLNNIQNDGDNQLARKRADFGFSSAFKTILVDCTTASPLAKDIKLKDYKAGKAADEAVNRKIKDYKRYFKIDENQRCNIFFFAVETSGGLSYEARKYVKLLAKISNEPMGWAIQRIYQELAVEIQNASLHYSE